jgi:hypothetical protein
MEFAQICDRIEIDAAPEPVDLSAFPGTWVNSNSDTNGIARILMTESGGKLSLQTFAIGPEGLIDWGGAEALLFTTGPASRLGAGFAAQYDFDFKQVRLQGMIMKGLLVLAQFHLFKDDSQRADYFAREYYALAHGRY